MSETGEPKVNNLVDEQQPPSPSVRRLSQSQSQEEEFKSGLPMQTQQMRQAPSEALAQLPPKTDVIVEDPGHEEEEEKKTGGQPTPAVTPGQGQDREGYEQPRNQSNRQTPPNQTPQNQTPQNQGEALSPQYAAQQLSPSQEALGLRHSPTPQGPSTIDNDSVQPPVGNLNSQSRIKVTLTQEGQKVHVDDGMMEQEQNQEPEQVTQQMPPAQQRQIQDSPGQGAPIEEMHQMQHQFPQEQEPDLAALAEQQRLQAMHEEQERQAEIARLKAAGNRQPKGNTNIKKLIKFRAQDQ